MRRAYVDKTNNALVIIRQFQKVTCCSDGRFAAGMEEATGLEETNFERQREQWRFRRSKLEFESTIHRLVR